MKSERDLFRYIDAHAGAFISDLQRLCRQPSVSAQGAGVEACAQLLASQMRAKGIPARTEPAPGGPPLVVAEIPGDSPRTLLIYDHYDVQPPDPLDEWDSDPFGAQIRDGRLFARGAQDTKGNIMARVAAVESWLRVRGRLPVTVRFLIEGEEEIGSPHLGDALRAHPELARADACLWESGAKDHNDVLNIYLGVKGILYVELEAAGARRDLHSASGGIVPNPAWRLVWALETLKGPDEQVRIQGFYDDVLQPTAAELAQVERIAAGRDDAAALQDLGIAAFVKHLTGTDLVRRNLFEPTCTICGLTAGYQGPGSKTVLPRRASAKVDFRLVPAQRPEDILAKLRDHLQREGFGDIAVRVCGMEEPWKTPADAPIVKVVAETAEEVYGVPPVILPTQAGTGPMHVVCAPSNLPAVGTGIGHARANVHGPNENIRLDDYIQGIKHVALILERFAG
ncbi:MAG: M20/M25/M40 family metallo-hydrolase [Armatimonadota bacterium]|nr:M20/M25/M40 family metallo-hydrolase [Armatimonadota bacterium]